MLLFLSLCFLGGNDWDLGSMVEHSQEEEHLIIQCVFQEKARKMRRSYVVLVLTPLLHT